jgi:uncharacterized protein YjbI with pentapeptide repeats
MSKQLQETPAGEHLSAEAKTASETHDLDAARRSVEDAASVAAGLWLSYLFALFYIGIASGGVTHFDLLLERTVKLPFLSVELPLIAFFVLAPILFIVSHTYTLVHFIMLAAKVGGFDAALAAEHPALATQESLRRRLPSNVFVQFLSGPGDVRKGGLGLLLKAIAWSSLVVGPILLLLLIQAQFLPFHHEVITWLHRCAILADVILLWLLWPAVLESRSTIAWPSLWRYKWAALASLVPIALAFGVATFPSERISASIDRLETLPPRAVTAWLGRGLNDLHDLLFHGEIDQIRQRRDGLFSDTLVLSNFNAQKTAKIENLEFASVRQSLILRGRHLEGAVFLNTDLRKVDLTDARLQGAQLAGAQLQGAILDGAQLQGAKLDWAQLQGANLNRARLLGAWLDSAQLQGATLTGAGLQGAWLRNAQLQGATLEKALLFGASLKDAQLQGASLLAAQLQGVDFAGAALKATSLTHAYLWRARFDPQTFLARIQARDAGVIWDEAQTVWDQKTGVGTREPWTMARYLALETTIETDAPQTLIENAPEPNLRALALRQIASLNPERPFEARSQTLGWRKEFESAMVGPDVFAKALAEELKSAVCSGGVNAPYILRGLLNNYRIRATQAQAKALIEEILKPATCAVASNLTDNDRAELQAIAKEAGGAL